jgi:hypothetical protein
MISDIRDITTKKTVIYTAQKKKKKKKPAPWSESASELYRPTAESTLHIHQKDSVSH